MQNVLTTERTDKGNGRARRLAKVKRQFPLHLMLAPSVVLGVIFMIVPLFGLAMAFQDYEPALGIFGSTFVDVYQFKVLFTRADFKQILFNTVFIALMKIILLTVLSIVFALLINEIGSLRYKKTIQTIVFLPYFLSWVLIGSIFVEMFSLYGSVNYILKDVFHLIDENIYFIADNRYFRGIVIGTDIWKMIGYQIVVFLAAITNIDPTLYEAAKVDGANRIKMCRHITLPGMSTMITLMCVLNIGNIMNAGFEQILVMYNPNVYETGDILDTMAYRVGLIDGKFSAGTAIGLFKSVISCILFAISYRLAYKVANYKLF